MSVTPEAAYYLTTANGFQPTPASMSPWDPANVNGVALAGLLAHLVEGSMTTPMSIARLTIDILGTAPRKEMIPRVRVLREGARLRIVEAELEVDGRVVARANSVMVRIDESPVWETGQTLPDPETLPIAPPSSASAKAQQIERRIAMGGPRIPGPGAMWVKFDMELVQGIPMTPLVRSALVSDFGSSIGSVLAVEHWTFANVDISLHYIRMPRGEWVLLESGTETAGNGLGIVTSRFSDRDGVYAHGHQILFVNARGRPGAASPVKAKAAQ